MKRSIIAAFSAATAGGAGDDETLAAAKVSNRPPRVAAGVIGAAARSVTDLRQELDDLKRSGAARMLDPDLLDPSPFSDRMLDTDDADFKTLRQLIEEEGQKVAVQVRDHPRAPGRFQIIYGHRRWRVAKDLGRPVKAEVVQATDEELAIAQGVENSARQDLTWIERATFACRLDTFGIKAKGIRAALAVDDAEITRFRSVCRALPLEVIRTIGRAPKIGRPRWIEMASAVAAVPDGVERIKKTLAADKVLAAPSDEKFRLALACLREKGLPAGKVSVRVGLVVGIDKTQAEAFSSFLRAELPDLLAKFLASQGANKP